MRNACFFFCLFLLLASTVTTDAQVNELDKLENNIKAPQILARDVKGNIIRLHSLLKENKKILLCFMRPIWCPIGNQRTHELIQRYEQLKESGLEVIAIYPTREDILIRYTRDANIPFHVIADPDELMYKSYAVERNLELVLASAKRDDVKKLYKQGQVLYDGKTYLRNNEDYDAIINADFVVGTKRMLKIAYYGKFVGDFYNLDNLPLDSE